MSGEIQFLPFGKDLDLVKNTKSNFLRVKLKTKECRVNHSSLKVVNKKIYLGEYFNPVDLIDEVKSPVGLILKKEQIQRLIGLGVIRIYGANSNYDQPGIYVINFEYYSQRRGAFLTVEDFVNNGKIEEKIDLRKNVKTKLDLTRYYRHANGIN